MAGSKLPYFFLGVGVGAALGVLFAPESGEELRGDIRNGTGAGRDYASRRGDEIRDEVRARAGDLVDRGREVLESRRGDLEAALEAGRRAYRDATGQSSDETPAHSASA